MSKLDGLCDFQVHIVQYVPTLFCSFSPSSARIMDFTKPPQPWVFGRSGSSASGSLPEFSYPPPYLDIIPVSYGLWSRLSWPNSHSRPLISPVCLPTPVFSLDRRDHQSILSQPTPNAHIFNTSPAASPLKKLLRSARSLLALVATFTAQCPANQGVLLPSSLPIAKMEVRQLFGCSDLIGS